MNASKTNFNMESHVFTVHKYVVPKFKLNLNISPSFVTFNSSKFIASVNPTYTFGKRVTGKCVFVHKRFNSAGASRQVTKALNVHANSTSNSVEFDSVSDLGIESSQVTLQTSLTLRITAECEDSITGGGGSSYKETIDFKMYQCPYAIERVKDREDVKRGFNYTLKLRVLSADKKTPILEASELRVNYLGRNETLRGLSNGETLYQILVPSDTEEDSVVLSATYKDYTKQFALHLSAKTSKNEYIKVCFDPAMSSVESPPTEGNRIYLKLFSTFNLSHLNLIGLSRGDIIFNDIITDIPTKITPSNLYQGSFIVRLPRRVPPTLTLFAYTSTQQFVVSDTFKFNVRQSERLGVNLTVSATASVQPGDNVTITIEGLSNCIFGLRAVDESTRLLTIKGYPDKYNNNNNNNNDLHTNKLSSVEEQLRIWNPEVLVQPSC